MRSDVHYTCCLRGCSDTATDLHPYTWQNRAHHSLYCRHHYLAALRTDEIMADPFSF